jgi:hypothetical protein
LKHKDEFDSMRFNFIAYPLRVYWDKTFIELRDVIEALMGAVIEVYFGIRHYYLCNKKFNMFYVEIQQIKIMKPGCSIMTSGFKRCNACKRLLDVSKIVITNGGCEEDMRVEKEKGWIKRNDMLEYIQ